jgi:nucleotide-binding universal stress UspA family protein
MSKILVPTDFSDHSEIALEFALQIANKSTSQVTLLNVFDVPELSDSWIQNDYDHTWEEVLIKAKADLKDKMVNLSKKYPTNAKLICQIAAGSPLEEILKLQVEKNFDLLILGVKKNNDIGSYLFGTFTDRLVHRSSMPVLVIKKKIKINNIRKVILGHEFKANDSDLPENINKINSLAKVTVELLRVNTPSDFMSEDVFDNRVKELKGNKELSNCTYASINFKNSGDGLLYHAAKHNFDMIAIGDKRTSTLRRWVLGEDLAEHVMDYTSLPVIIF